MNTRLWNGRRVPFTLLGGYLGAGKTTVVNHLVRHAAGRRLVVLVNDVGAIDVDAALVAEHDGTTMSLSNGCVCCSIADDFGRTLEQIRTMPEPPDHVVAELSGVAEPARVAPWAATAGFRLDGIVVVADADLLPAQLERTLVGDTLRAQLAAADLVLVTKTDLAVDGGARAFEAIDEITAAPRVVVDRGAVEVALVLGIDRAEGVPTPTDAEPVGYRAWLIDVGRPTLDELRALLDQFDRSVLRAKGLVECEGSTYPIEVHVVGTRRTLRPRPDLGAAPTDQRLVAIGLRADDLVADHR